MSKAQIGRKHPPEVLARLAEDWYKNHPKATKRIAKAYKRRYGKPMPTIKLSQAEVLIIKKRIYYGATREILAKDFDVTVGQICNIGAGFKWKDIKWPDGTYGAMSAKRSRMIEEARREVHAEIEPLIEKKLKSMEREKRRKD